ncbi:MAG: hypothetical protein KA715_08545 [Xanthomonadaceae bacterium]|nr:hypothetical protein [Xanthomonadaceae bacterium]
MFLFTYSASAQKIYSTEQRRCNLKISQKIPTDVATLLDQSLEFLANIKGTKGSRAHRKLFGGTVSGETYCSFLEKNIYSIGYSLTSSDVFASNFGGSVLLSDQVLQKDYIVLASALLHEALHTNYGSHVKCPSNKGEKLKGKNACDNKALSSYGSHYIFAKNLEKHCLNCSATEIESSLELGNHALKRIIGLDSRIRLRLGY